MIFFLHFFVIFSALWRPPNFADICTRTQTVLLFIFLYSPQLFTNKNDYLTCNDFVEGLQSHAAQQRLERIGGANVFRAAREAAGSRETWRLTGASVNLRCVARLSYIPLMTCAQLCLPLTVKLPRAKDVGLSEHLLLCVPRRAYRLYSTRTAEQGGLGAGTLRLWLGERAAGRRVRGCLDGWGFGIEEKFFFRFYQV